jgi:hypothetical protein
MMAVKQRSVAGIVVLCSVIAATLSFASFASATLVPAPAWQIEESANPSTLEPGSGVPEGYPAIDSAPKLRVAVTNVGGAPFSSATVTDVLPTGLVPSQHSEPVWRASKPTESEFVAEPCRVVTNEVICEIPFAIRPGTSVVLFIPLEVEASGPMVLTNEVTADGVGGPVAGRRVPVRVGQPQPGFSFAPFAEEGVRAGAFDQAGGSPGAGTHPFLMDITSKVESKLVGAGSNFAELRPDEALRSLELSLPNGVVINPRALPVRCSRADFELGEGGCPSGSQVGLVYVSILGGIEYSPQGLYDLVPEPGVPAELGFALTGATVAIRGGLSGDFHLTAHSSELLSRYAIDGVNVQLWGVPSDSRHDLQRSSNLPGEQCYSGCSVTSDTAPFVTMPSACSTSLEFHSEATSWVGSATGRTEILRTAGGDPESVEGCAELGFSPAVTVTPSTSVADSPSGLAFDLKVPQSEALGGSATSTLKRVTVQLPAGMAVNPPAANGLGACSSAQIGLGKDSSPTCPEASKVGSAEISTPLLQSPLKGGIYLAEQKNNPFGTLLALYVAVEGEGIVVKLPGRVDVDAQTGQVTATFDDNPQLPFEELKVGLNSGSRAALVTASSCGNFKARTELTSWASSTPVVLESPITVNGGCSNSDFAPLLEAGTVNPAAGRYSPFTLRVTRRDGEQNLAGISATLPEGLLAKLAEVPLCGDIQAATGACPVDSQVGTTTVGAGAGTQPLYIPQPGKAPTAVYLAGPYKGGPYSLVVKVPAQAGPFDLGTIDVRVALQVDPYTARVTAIADRLPQILEGIPIAYRDVRVDINRQGFIVNPTSCEPMKVISLLSSTAGATASPSSGFQVAGCERLPFKPKLALSVKGATKRNGHPALRAVVTFPKGTTSANISSAQVGLPHSEFLEQGNIRTVCKQAELKADTCPAASIYGRATAYTPLLDKPLEGPVYLGVGFGHKLPDLVADLNGQLRILLRGRIDTDKQQGIRNTFEAVPDAPVSKFILELNGGKKKGLIVNSTNICKGSHEAEARFAAHSGKVESFKVPLANSCKSKGQKKRGKRGP